MQLIAIVTIFIISVHLSTSLHQQPPTPLAQSPPPPTTSPASPASPPLPETTTYTTVLMELTCQQPPTTSCSLVDLAYPTPSSIAMELTEPLNSTIHVRKRPLDAEEEEELELPEEFQPHIQVQKVGRNCSLFIFI